MTDFTRGLPGDAAGAGFQAGSLPRLQPGSMAETLIYVLTALTLLSLSVVSSVIATPLGFGVAGALTLALCLARPTAAPILIIAAFLLQNTIVAVFTPLIPSDAAFDAVRGTNFVILMTAYAVFLAASLQRAPLPGLRGWILGCLALLVIICFYLALGVMQGEPRDAIVYFRNTITPIACLHIALVLGSRFRVDLTRGIAWLAAVAVAYGYCELLFRLEFLSLFNGDDYIARQMAGQVDSGYWEKMLRNTGYVFSGLTDVMTTSFLNFSFFDNILVVWRIAGPNFHPISFAYALTVMAVFLLFRGRWILPLLALPLLLVVGSKGALALLLLAIGSRLAMRFFSARLVTLAALCAAAIWITAAVAVGGPAGDFHVLGFFAGLRDFLSNPLGVGLGLGGNISTAAIAVDWERAQATGATDIPVESAVGVMLYQMGVGSIVFLGFLAALAMKCRQLFLRTADETFLFGFLSITMIGANAVLQEEAIYSPLAMAFCLLLTGVALGSHYRDVRPESAGAT